MKKIISILTVSVSMMLISLPAFANEHAAADSNSWLGFVGLGAGLAIGLAALGGSLGQGKAAAAALEGIARNPQASGKIMTPMIIGLALIESLVIYGLLIGIFLNGHIADNVAMDKEEHTINLETTKKKAAAKEVGEDINKFDNDESLEQKQKAKKKREEREAKNAAKAK